MINLSDTIIIKLTAWGFKREEGDVIQKEIKSACASPRIFLSNFFTDMRNEVDLAYLIYSISNEEGTLKFFK